MNVKLCLTKTVVIFQRHKCVIGSKYRKCLIIDFCGVSFIRWETVICARFILINVDGLMKERCNSIANTLGLRLSFAQTHRYQYHYPPWQTYHSRSFLYMPGINIRIPSHTWGIIVAALSVLNPCWRSRIWLLLSWETHSKKELINFSCSRKRIWVITV